MGNIYIPDPITNVYWIILHSLFITKLVQLKIELDILLKYLDGDLPASKREKLEDVLLANPEYFKILKGLSLLKKEVGSRRQLKEYLSTL